MQRMFRLLLALRRTKLAVAAAVAVGFWPAIAEAGILAFRNDTDFPIMVQVSIINRIAWRGKLHVLRPGEFVRELHLVPGPKLVIVFDAKQPTRVLCKQFIPFTGTDLFYAIQREGLEKGKEGAADSAKAKVHKAVLPKVRLVPSPPVPPVPLSPSNTHR
jgi:hypothetical protein